MIMRAEGFLAHLSLKLIGGLIFLMGEGNDRQGEGNDRHSLSPIAVYVNMFDRNCIMHKIVLVGMWCPSAVHQYVHQHFKQLKGAPLAQLIECQTLMARSQVRTSPGGVVLCPLARRFIFIA